MTLDEPYSLEGWICYLLRYVLHNLAQVQARETANGLTQFLGMHLGGISITIRVSRPGARQFVLRGVSRSLSGRYRCEVSADAPYFHTVYESAFMRVEDLPESGPIVRAQKSCYSVGDMLRANCTSPPSDPPANLTWLINGYEGHLNVTCVARILSVWFASGAILLDEERPQIAPVMV